MKLFSVQEKIIAINLVAEMLLVLEDYEVAVVPPKARALLSRFDVRSQHYEVKTSRIDF